MRNGLETDGNRSRSTEQDDIALISLAVSQSEGVRRGFHVPPGAGSDTRSDWRFAGDPPRSH
jgi:hypothetical protein